jgi:hypothetical protein
MAEGEDLFTLRTNIRHALDNWHPIEVSFEGKKDILREKPLKVKPLPIRDNNALCYPIEVGQYNWYLQIQRGQGEASMELGFSLISLEANQSIDIDAVLLTFTF